MRVLFAVVMLVTALVSAMPAAGEEYRYVKQQEFRDWLTNGKQMIVVDIQEPDEFAAQHFRGAIDTGAYPVKTDEDRRKLERAVRIASSSTADVVIICPRGAGGAKKSYDYLKARGIAEPRLYILEKGMQGWPFPELTVHR